MRTKRILRPASFNRVSMTDHQRAAYEAEKKAPPLAWISTAQFAADSVGLAELLPDDVNRIVGVPRSGMIAASIVATHLHLPLWELSEGEFRRLGNGSRGFRDGPGRTVVIDDTVYGGGAMARAKQFPCTQGCLFAATYIRPDKIGVVDFFARVLGARSHLLEWNFWNNHGILLGGVATDFDGILCEEPTAPDADEGPGLERYGEWLSNARPKMLPRCQSVRLIVTGRLERWRTETEKWLARWGVRCDRLVMYPADRASQRGDVGAWKGGYYRDSKTGFFVESDPAQAGRIFEVSGKQVICPAISKVWFH